MYLDTSKSLGLISALALGVAFGCSSKKTDDTVGSGGAATFCVNGCVDGGATGGAQNTPLDPNYCDGLLKSQICAQTNLQADVREVDMLIVLDESGSMQFPPLASATQTKWAMMNQALNATLPNYASNISFGLELFPYDPAGTVDKSNPDSACGVPSGPAAIAVDIAAGTDNLTQILTKVSNQTPAGGTPTTKALQQAYAYFSQGAGKDLNPNAHKYVLLVTDGGPNCNSALQCGADTCTQNLDGQCGDGSDPNLNCCTTSTAAGAQNKANLSCLDQTAVVSQITQLQALGVKTYVIGIPGAEPYGNTLDEMAVAGGVPSTSGTHSFYEVTAANALVDLQNALDGIITQLVKTCDITLKSTPTSVGTVQVVKDCQFIPALPDNKAPGPDSGVQDGYYIDYQQSPAHLILTGSVCTSIQTAGANHLDVIEGCYNPN